MNKDKVFELMIKAGCPRYCNPEHPELEGFIVNDSVLERVVAIIEREVRGDAEPVAWQYYDEQSGQWVTGMNTNNHREHTQNAGYKTRDLFAHPTPAVVQQLVEALEFCRFSLEPYDDIKPRDWRSDRENLRRAHQQAKAALAAANESGIWAQ